MAKLLKWKTDFGENCCDTGDIWSETVSIRLVDGIWANKPSEKNCCDTGDIWSELAQAGGQANPYLFIPPLSAHTFVVDQTENDKAAEVKNWFDRRSIRQSLSFQLPVRTQTLR